jgi:P27 family predicted phage terminase small subunit
LKKSATHAPPTNLSPEARAWWKRLHAEFDLTDEAAAFLLESALRAFDRMNQAGEIVDRHGVAVADKFGQLKANPAVAAERDSRAAMLQAFKALNLDVLPSLKVGRPTTKGGGSWE